MDLLLLLRCLRFWRDGGFECLSLSLILERQHDLEGIGLVRAHGRATGESRQNVRRQAALRVVIHGEDDVFHDGIYASFFDTAAFEPETHTGAPMTGTSRGHRRATHRSFAILVIHTASD